MTFVLSMTDDEVESLGRGEPIVRDDTMTSAEGAACVAELDALDAAGRLDPAGTGRERRADPAVRGDRTMWASDAPGPALSALRKRFGDLRQTLNSEAWLGLRSFEVQLAIYPANGASYAAHRDTFVGDPRRRATAILYLSPAWTQADGGCLRVQAPSGERDISPLGGRLVVFLSGLLLHEVLPSHAIRRAATAWYGG